MSVSTRGNQRSSYIHYEDSFRKTLLLYQSDMVESTNIHHKNAKYNISLNNTISCKNNQIMTCALHSADIPITTYNINRFNDTFYLYLPDWNHVEFVGGYDAGVIPVQLSRRNYTSSQFVVAIQKALDDLVDSTFSDSFSIDVGEGLLIKEEKDDGYTTVLGSEFPSIATVGGAEATVMNGMFSGFSDSVPDHHHVAGAFPNYIYGNTNFSYTANGKTTLANIGRKLEDWVTEKVWSDLYIKTQPRFKVSLEDTDRIQIQRIDLLGAIPNKGDYTGSTWYLTSGLSNHHQFGLNRASRTNHIPIQADFTSNIYNTTGRFDDTRESGESMRANYQNAEFRSISTTLGTTHKNTVFFPNIVNLNAKSTILIKSSKLKANVYNSGKHSNVIAKIPINVQQGEFVNYEPQSLVRYNLGNSAEVQFIDIELTDGEGQILDFNGVPHTLAFLFEIWDVVSVPLNKQDQHFTAHDNNSKTLTDSVLPQRFETQTPSTFGQENSLLKRRR